ncbi:hypothetical protein L204_105868 [Cryptococcus depauperatus]
MSDDEFGDDSIFLDDSFLRKVDEVAAQVVPSKTTSFQPVTRFLVGASRSASSNAVDSETSNNARKIPRTFSAPGPSKAPQNLTRNSPLSLSRSIVACSKQAPSSDNYDEIEFPIKNFEELDAAMLKPSNPPKLLTQQLLQTQLTPQPNPNYVSKSPSQRVSSASRPSVMSRSSKISAGNQTHLNFRKESRYTPGKRWDRTAFAKSGRRLIPLTKQDKGKGKLGEVLWGDDDCDDDQEDLGDLLAPQPLNSFDPTKPYGLPKHLPSAATISAYIYPTNRQKRTYQYDIVRNCFLDNTLVALPTGLGKTFVAGVVMLNLQQQIEACQKSCGIPSRDTAVMTGQSEKKKERERLWDERRVFYCTPQTLENDLKSGAVNPEDIVLLVFDEAHKATGNFSYTTILAYITSHHPYFRVLALTATPGSDVEKVQNVVDALHISRIEIREAEAPEIKRYTNEKHITQHIVRMTDVIQDFRDRWGALMIPYVQKLVGQGVLNERDLDVKRLRTFRITSIRMQLQRKKQGTKNAIGSLNTIEKMARAMGHLLEFSIGMFHTTLNEMVSSRSSSSNNKKNVKSQSNALFNNLEFQKLQRDVNEELNSIKIRRNGKSGADRHPKMVKTLELLLAHFAQANEEEITLGQKNDTRAMIFCSFRACVIELVDMLNEHSGLLRAAKFVGQANGKEERDKGYNQKEQKQTINDFKSGKYNILVSTSIGEEGLDIGEVDFAVLYDMPRQSIKLLQRIGRTGRARDGQVHVLMSELREDMNWDTAQQTHRDIQEEILHSRNLELFEDVEPLLPDRKIPDCIEEKMSIDPWDPDDPNFKKQMADAEKAAKKAAKRQGKITGGTKGEGTRKKNKMRDEVPVNAKGFTSVADLLREADRIVARPETDEESDEEINSNSMAIKGMDKTSSKSVIKPRTSKRKRSPSPIRPESVSGEEQDISTFLASRHDRDGISKVEKEAKIIGANLSSLTKNKNCLIKGTRAIADREMSPPTMRTSEQEELTITSNEENRQTVPVFKDSDAVGFSKVDDVDSLFPPSKKAKLVQPVCQDDNLLYEEEKDDVSLGLDFFQPEGPLRRGFSPSPAPLSPQIKAFENSSPDKNFHDSSPGCLSPDPDVLVPPSPPAQTMTRSCLSSNKLSPRTAAAAGFSQIDPMDLVWDGEDEDSWQSLPLSHQKQSQVLKTPGLTVKPDMPPPPFPSTSKKSASALSSSFASAIGNTSTLETQIPMRRLGLRRVQPFSSSPDTESPLPRIEPNARSVNAIDSDTSPVVAFGRRVRGGRLRRRVLLEDSSSPVRNHSSRAERAQQERPRTARVENDNRHSKRKKRLMGAFFELDAELSGSDSDDNSEHSMSSIETESDRQFANNFAPTQAPKGYNQCAMYLAGLGTQAQDKGLKFKRDIAEERKAFLQKAKKPVYISDDEGAGGRSSENEYELGSFVVNDDDDMGYYSNSSGNHSLLT